MGRRFARPAVSALYTRLVRLCRRRGCPLEDARDVVQEAYLRLCDYQRSGKVWNADLLVRRIVIHLSINYYHREPSRNFAFESVKKLDRRSMLADPVPDPERTLDAQQQLDKVVRLLSAVSPRTCQIFIAQRGGYSYDEIGGAFAIKPHTVEKHVASAAGLLAEHADG